MISVFVKTSRQAKNYFYDTSSHLIAIAPVWLVIKPDHNKQLFHIIYSLYVNAQFYYARRHDTIKTSVFKTGPANEPKFFWVMGHCGSTGSEPGSIGFT